MFNGIIDIFFSFAPKTEDEENARNKSHLKLRYGNGVYRKPSNQRGKERNFLNPCHSMTVYNSLIIDFITFFYLIGGTTSSMRTRNCTSREVKGLKVSNMTPDQKKRGNGGKRWRFRN